MRSELTHGTPRRLIALLLAFLILTVSATSALADAPPAPEATPSTEASPTPDESPTPEASPTAEESPAPETSSTPGASPAPSPAPNSSPAPTTSLLVKLVSGLTSAQQAAVLARNGGTQVDSVPALRLHIVEVDAASADETIAAYGADAQVQRVERDRTRESQAAPSDPGYGDQWALGKIGWNSVFGTVTPSGSAKIAVLDTGVDSSTPDLAGRLVAGFSAIEGESPTADVNGHGTRLASIAAALTDNGVGIAGVAYDGVSIQPVKVLDGSGLGQDSNIIEGVVWAADHGADVILMAFSNPGFSPDLQDAIDYAWSKGAVIVASTGNDGSSTPNYPAGDARVVGVSATDENDALWSGSNFGTHTFIAAPGVGIASADGSVTGTSASAAIVAGAAALLRAVDGSASNGVIVGRLARTADAAGTAAQTGNGRLNLARAISDTSVTPVVPAGAPTGGPFVGPYSIDAAENLDGWGNTSNGWVGTVQGSNSAYKEGQSLPIRYSNTFAAGSSHTLIVKYDYSAGASRFIDHLTTVDRSIALTTAQICAGLAGGATGCAASPVVTAAIPVDTSNAPLGARFSGQLLRAWNVSSISFVGSTYALAGNVKSIAVNFTVSGASGNRDVAIAYGAHLARGNEWGPGNGADSFSGASSKGFTNLDGANSDRNVSVNPNGFSVGGQIQGSVYNDFNGNGALDAGEPGLNGVTVTLSGGATTALTQANGSYAFTGLDPGTYTVDYTEPAGFVNTGTPRPRTGIVVATDTSIVTGNNFFAQQRNASISGTVYSDPDGTGTLTAGDAGLAGVTVSLSGGTPAITPTTTTTDALGNYSFSGLQAGTYTVDYTEPTGYVNTGTSRPRTVVLAVGGTSTANNFFAQQNNGSISGLVYDDADGSGTLTAGDLPKGGVTVFLDANNNGTLDLGEASTTTATSGTVGSYTFGGLAAATYRVTYVIPSGYENLGPRPIVVVLAAGATSTGNNFFARRTTSTALALTTGTDPSTYGDSLTFTATVTSLAGNPSSVGTVTFMDGASVVCSGVGLSGNTATCTTSTLGVGSHSITATYSGTSAGTGYGGSTSAPLAHTVNKAVLTVSAEDKSREYGDANPTLTATITGFKNGETLATSGVTGSPSLSTGATTASPVGTYPITAALGTLASTNYSFTFVNGTLTVTKAVLTVIAEDESREYGAANPTFTATFSGFKNGETLATSGVTGAPSLTATATAATAVGTYPITAGLGTLASGNYSFSFVDGTLTITKAVLTVTADNKSREYGDANPTLTATITGFKNGETLATSGVTGSPSLTTAATTGSPVGPYPITAALGTLASSNYSFAFVDGTLSVTKAVLTVTAEDESKVYGSANPILTATFSGFKNGETLATSGVTGVPTLTTTATTSSPVGPYPITAALGTLAASNYSFTFVNGTLIVTRAVLTVTADDESRAYGDPNPTFTASYSGFQGSDTFASSVTGAPSLTATATPTSPVGTYTITAALGTLASDNYSFSFVNGTLTITKAVLTVTADNKSRAYGDANPTFTAGFSGFKNGETLGTSGVTGAPSLTTAATATSPVGAYTITAAVGSLASDNYSFSFVSGTLTVTKAVLTVTAEDTPRAYGAANPTFTAALSGFKNGETLATSGVTGAPSLTTAATPASAAGTYTITAGLGTLASGNYSFSFVNGTLTITKAVLTVTADDESRVYGDANPTFTATITGFQNGETLATSGVTGVPSLTTTATATSPVGSYTITAALGTLASDNYSFSFVNGTLTVTKAVLTVTAEDESRIYGDANPTFTASYAGFKNGETLATSGVTGAPSLSTTATATSAVGTYPITAALGSLASDNYSFSFVNGTLTISKAVLTVTAEDKAREYGDANPTFTAAYSGFKNGETLATSGVTGAPSLTTAATATSPVGTYTITAALGTLASDNYSFSFVNGTLTITKAVLTVTADDKSREYGEPNPTFTANYSGFKNGETLATSGVTGIPSLSTTAAAASAVGAYPITAAQGTLASDNYSFSFVNGTLTITKAPLTITAADKTKVYGDPNPTLTGSIDGLKNGDPITATYTTAATQSSPVGTYAIVPAAVDSSPSTLGNYDVTLVNGTLTVTKAVLTVTAEDESRIYGDANPTFTAAYSGFKNGETLATSGVTGAPSLTTTATPASPVGTYTITAALGSLASDNYSFSFVNGTLSVTKAVLTVTAEDKSREYGDANPTFTAAFSGFKNGETLATSGVTGAPSLTTTAVGSSPIGTYPIISALGSLASGNYSFSFVNGTLTITKAPLTITAGNQSREYGEPNATLTGSIVGIKNGDGITATYSTSATALSPVATYAILPAAVDSSPSTLGNYDVTLVNGTLTVTKAVLTVMADNKSRVYGDVNPTFTASYSGFKNGETLATSGVTGAPSLTTTATPTTDVGTYPITAALGTLASGNYSLTFVNGTLTITKAPLTITAADKTRIYGDPNPTLTGSIVGLKNGDPIAATYSTAATQASPVGTYAIVPAAVDSSPSKLGNYDVTLVDGTLTVTTAVLTVTGIASPASVQYSDPTPPLSYTITGFQNGETLATSGVTGADTITCSTTRVQLDSPEGSYPITCNIAGLASSNYSFAAVAGSLAVTKEDALIEYTGDVFKNTSSTNTNTTSVTLSAIIREAGVTGGPTGPGPEPAGSIGNKLPGRQLRFDVFPFSGGSAVATCSPTIVAVAGEPGTGTASCVVTLAAGDPYDINVSLVTNGFYIAPVETAAITVSLPGTGFVTGGGWLYEPNIGTKSNFGFTVKRQKNGNLQGNSVYIYRKTLAVPTTINGVLLPAGDYNWKIKSNSWAGGGLNTGCTTTTPKLCTATFVGKANIKAISRSTGIEYSLGGNYTYQVDIDDYAEPGSSPGAGPDRYAIRVWNSSGTYYQLGSPRTWNASRLWDTTYAGYGTRLNIVGGNIQVH